MALQPWNILKCWVLWFMNCTLIKKKIRILFKNYYWISLTLEVYNELEIVHLYSQSLVSFEGSIFAPEYSSRQNILPCELLRFIFPYVLVHSRCYNKTLVAAGAYKQQKFYLSYF